MMIAMRPSLLVLALVLAACARSAPELPADRSSVNAAQPLFRSEFKAADLALACDAIANEQREIRSKADAYNRAIDRNRGQNQAMGYIGAVLFLPAVLATEHNEAEKAELDRLQNRHDELIALRRINNC